MSARGGRARKARETHVQISLTATKTVQRRSQEEGLLRKSIVAKVAAAEFGGQDAGEGRT